MRIKKLHIQNFKSLVDFQLEDIPQFCAFVGPNASGKSNIFEALEFLNYVATYNFNAPRYFNGKSSIQSFSPSPILTNVAVDVQYLVEFEDLIRIECDLIFNKENEERLQSIIRAPFEDKAPNLPITDILNLESRKRFLDIWKSSRYEYEGEYEIFIDNFSRIFVGKPEPNKPEPYNKLSNDASNTAQILGKIFQDEAKKEDFTEWLSILIPEFESIEVIESGIDGEFKIFVSEKSHAKRFPIKLLSDGTKNILALMAAVYQSSEPQFLCIEEPENGLHPHAIEQLIELFRLKCEEEGHHIWLNTHSQTLVRSLKTEEIILVNKISGETKAKQLTKKDDYGMKTDEAWLTNFFGGGVL